MCNRHRCNEQQQDSREMGRGNLKVLKELVGGRKGFKVK